ncbi:hypothetical protein [Streptomyces hesseae]|uniref:Baseplate assembly protein n=1 Tax=Streptomyces hesseae TaxID=3075519 RepID=A0ABU2SL35_9ACTN|nr:hypothetical protein [Streptomyces sp. DSM 40473]MDT0449602.1 hypothetical protein [Streptomyces sp. DSM 40473]
MADPSASSAPDPSGVPVPDLDDLRFQPLVDAAKRALPQRAPEWTDHNVSDPGITLIEACAERTDQLLYRVNRMTARQRSALLRLMGITPLPASPTRIVVAFTRTDGSTARREIPAGTVVRTGGEEPVVLATVSPLVLEGARSTGTVAAEERLVRVTEVLGVADGRSAGRFPTRHRPWRPGAPVADPPFGPPVVVRVEVAGGGGGVEWRAVPTFAEAGPDDRVHWWDDASSEVVFGPLVPAEDGERQHGKVPPEGARISAEYDVFRGREGAVQAGAPLTVDQPELTAVVDTVVAVPVEAEDWRVALERAGLGLAPPRRAVTAADHERIIDEHVPGLARVRVMALTRPTDSRVPIALQVPSRPPDVLTSAVAARDPLRAVHYYDDSGTITPLAVPLGQPDGPAADEDTVPGPVQEAKRLDAVIRTGETAPRLWFYGDMCLWGGNDRSPQPIKDEFPELPGGTEDPARSFRADLDAVAVLAGPERTDAYELFFFKGETFYHRAYTYGDRSFVPRAESRGVTSLISESFPGLSPECQESPDAVVVVGGVFYFVKGARTEPAVWRREDDPLHVLLVPHVTGDPSLRPPDGAFDIPQRTLASVVGVVEASRLLGERLRVGKPRYHSFGIAATVRPWSSTRTDVEQAREAAEGALRRFFHPTAGGPDGRGWPWGRRVHAGDVFDVLEKVPRLRGTTEVILTDDGGRPVSSVEVSDGGLVLLEDVGLDIAPADG